MRSREAFALAKEILQRFSLCPREKRASISGLIDCRGKQEMVLSDSGHLIAGSVKHTVA